jgi:transglutaminase-like putative cysteine protease
MTLLKIVHKTSLQYSSPASFSYNEIRMSPIQTDFQQIRSHDIKIIVDGEEFTESKKFYTDYFGTHTLTFEILPTHNSMEILSDSLVNENGEYVQLDPHFGWESIYRACNDPKHSWELGEFLQPTNSTICPPEVLELASQIASTSPKSPHDCALEVVTAIRNHLEYKPYSTSVSTTAQQAWDLRAGVCQDISHICVAALRSLGIPAKYVSGYLAPGEEFEFGQKVIGESHAWVEWWAGDWYSYDPTNYIAAGPNHITVAKGRDYFDVPPMRGVFSGIGTTNLNVVVEITKL